VQQLLNKYPCLLQHPVVGKTLKRCQGGKIRDWNNFAGFGMNLDSLINELYLSFGMAISYCLSNCKITVGLSPYPPLQECLFCLNTAVEYDGVE